MKKMWKRAGIALGVLLSLGLLSFGLAELKTRSRLSRKFDAHRIDLPLPPARDAAAIARGRHLVEARYGCSACHGATLAGGVMIDDPAIGRVLGPNLTPGKGGRVSNYGMVDWDRIVRHGIKPDGTAALMPSEDFFKMSDAELSDIVAYLRSLPAVDAVVPPPGLGPVGKVLVALGKFPISAERAPNAPHLAQPPAAGDTEEFGAHLAAVCTTCHRQNLGGGAMAFGPPEWPVAANLTAHESGLRSWSYEDFDRALTQGVSKDGRKLREPMSAVIAGTRAMSSTERRAIWTYLRSLKPVATNAG